MSGGLKAGGSYSVTTTFRASGNLLGPWYVFVITDPPTSGNPRGQEFEGNNESNNSTAAPQQLIIDQSPPVDLQVTSVTVPSSAQSGGPVQIQWTVQNFAAINSANGSWSDSAYLSPDGNWNAHNPLIGRVVHNGPLGPGASYTSTLTLLGFATALGAALILLLPRYQTSPGRESG
jgi:hypothetical protein